MVPIEYVPYPQKEYGYCRMTHQSYMKLPKKLKFNFLHYVHIFSKTKIHPLD